MKDIKIPPSSQEAEDAILGAIIQSPSILDEVSAYLSKDIFYFERSKRLYTILLNMFKNDEDIDSITILGKISKTDIDMGVSAYYITGLMDKTGIISMAKRYAVQVYEKHLLREVVHQTLEISESAYNNNQDVYNILDDAHFTIGQLINIRPGLTFSIEDALKDTFDNIISSDKNIIKTGFKGIDELSGGMTRGEITVIGGRPGHGKTTTMLNMVKSCIDQGLKVIVFNREMTNVEMLKKLIVLESGKLSYLDVRLGYVGDLTKMGELEAVKKDIEHKYNADRFAMFDNMPSFDESAAQVKKFKPDVIFDDYIQLIAPDKKISERRLQLEKLVNSYKWLAKKQKCACILLSQLNRGLESRGDGKPKLSDLAESGAIEQVAENVLFVYYDHKVNMNKSKDGANIIELIGSKVRYGVSGSVKLGYDGDKVKMYNSQEEYRSSKLNEI
tara:strand:+ start:1447 stop:2781 length:1335 start_codon:yes stop_codon:yes gene_type:complete